MLPRHLRKVASSARSAGPSRRLSQRAGLSTGSPRHTPFRIGTLPGPNTGSRSTSNQRLHASASVFSNGGNRSFHASSGRRDELPKSPFQTFVDTLKEELQKNRDLQANVKQLQGDVDKLQDSEAMKRARAAYERARVSLFFQGFLFS